MNCENKYLSEIKRFCSTLTVEQFPHAAELMQRVITLRDIFFPIKLMHNPFGSPKKTDGACRRAVLCGAEGSGKTTLLSRITLAIADGERDIVEQYGELPISCDRFPLLINCAMLADSDATLGFYRMLYNVSVRMLGGGFESEVPFSDFTEMIAEKAENGSLLLLIDGWDEIYEDYTGECFRAALGEFLHCYEDCSTVVSLSDMHRRYDETTALNFFEDGATQCFINELSDEDVEEFCKKWYSVLYASDACRRDKYKLIVEQLQNPYYFYARAFAVTPLSLSNLLTVTRFDSKLPRTEAELFEKHLELHLSHYALKPSALPKDTVLTLLSYVAAAMIAQRKSKYSFDELCEVLEQCYTELDGYFETPMDKNDIDLHIGEMCKLGVFGNMYDMGYKFTMLYVEDYLAARAIVNEIGLSLFDDGDEPLALLESHFGDSAWYRIILFCAMQSDYYGRKIVTSLLDIQKTADSVFNRDMLFELMYSDVPVSAEIKNAVYAAVFEENITPKQMSLICNMTARGGTAANFLKEYVEKSFFGAVKDKTYSYTFAYAAVKLAELAFSHESPTEYAEKLLISDDENDVAAALSFFVLLGWIKYAGIRVPFEHYTVKYKIGGAARSFFSRVALNRDFSHLALFELAIRDCLLADFVTYDELFSADRHLLILNSALCGDELSRTLLSLSPIDERCFEYARSLSEEDRHELYTDLECDIATLEDDGCIFSFCLAAAAGVFGSVSEMGEALAKFCDMYTDESYVGDGSGKCLYDKTVARFDRLFADGFCTVLVLRGLTSMACVKYLSSGLRDTWIRGSFFERGDIAAVIHR